MSLILDIMSFIAYNLSMSTDKQYARELLIGMVGYIVLLLGSIYWVKDHLDNPWRFAVAVLPMIPLIYVARASVARINRLDEMQKQIQLTALAVTVLATALVTLTYGFLENVGAPHINVLWVWPLMGAMWGTSSVLASRYYS